VSGADAIVQVLADEGVDTIFGYSGGAILPTYDAVFRYNANRGSRPEVRLIVPASEQGAGFMAAGYSRSSGRVGVSLVTSGPGATNSVTPVRDCQADSIPMVLICGQVPRAAMGTDAFQEAPIFNIMTPCAKHVLLIKDETQVEATMRTAFHVARSGRPGPVVVDVPKDVQNAESIFRGFGLLPMHGYRDRLDALERTTLSAGDAESFYKLLRASQRPLVYAGGGIINGDAANELRAFAQHFGIPVVTTLMGIGGIDTTSELSMHMLGMHGAAYANYAVEDCDFLIALGSRFDDRVAGKVKEFAPGAKIAHLDIDASEIGKVKAVDWAHVANAKRGLAELLAFGKGIKTNFAKWRAHLGALKTRHAYNYNRESALVQPQFVLEQLNQVTNGEAIVSTGVGQHQMWAAQYLDFKRARTWLTSGSMGTMGFGLPAAIGAQLANPDALVIDVDGDGSIRHELRHPGEGPAAQQHGRRHGPAMAGPLLREPLLGHGQGPAQEGLREGLPGGRVRLRETRDDERGGPPGARGIRALPGTGVPRGHGGPERPRLSDGRTGHGLQGHDHRAVDPEPRGAARAGRGRPDGHVLGSSP
jgi:acetolactate synthase-1/2/3 large subunit